MSGITIRFIIFIAIAIAIIIWKYKRKRVPILPTKIEAKQLIMIFLIAACVFVIIGFWSRKYSEKNRSDLLAHKGTTVSVIDSYVPVGGTSSSQFKYTFSVNGLMYKGEHIGPFSSNVILAKFIGKQFTVIYDSLNPKRNFRMLITPKDFKDFNIPFPDSLKWIIPYYNN